MFGFICLHAANANNLSVWIDLGSELSCLKIGYSLSEMRPNASVAVETRTDYEPMGPWQRHIKDHHSQIPHRHLHIVQTFCCALQVKLNSKVLLLVETIFFQNGDEDKVSKIIFKPSCNNR